MGMLDEYQGQIKAIFSDWINIIDHESGLTIEDFPYDKGVPEDGFGDHCWKCITVNQCWFKNEAEKKPKKFDYSKYKFVLNKGLYHFFCHCEERDIKTPNAEDIQVIMPNGKIGWLFNNKLKLTQAWGYHTNEEQEQLVNSIIQLSKEAYATGRYKIREHTPRGVNATFFITIAGINEKEGHKYNII
ncbi:MAG: hypothetical protein IJ371_02815 [Clostridia bacterium]|nr:hypothetical protein [Clostridia bacterium]